VQARALHALKELGLLGDRETMLADLFNKLANKSIATRKEAASMLAEFGDVREVANRLIAASQVEEDPWTMARVVQSLSKIVGAGLHPDLLRPFLLRVSEHNRFEVRRESLAGLEAFPFDGVIADRLYALAAADGSRIVQEKAKRINAGRDRIDLGDNRGGMA